MTKQDFNIAIAEKVMGWKATPDDDDPFNNSGFTHHTEDGLVDGPDFHGDHNAAALVRARVAELPAGTQANFVMSLLVSVQQDMNLPEEITWYHLWLVSQATPEQTARAAYMAVTGEELEAVDE